MLIVMLKAPQYIRIHFSALFHFGRGGGPMPSNCS
jgi:hypothetical protein